MGLITRALIWTGSWFIPQNSRSKHRDINMCVDVIMSLILLNPINTLLSLEVPK